MKFLVLALCVCAASAASFGSFGSFSKQSSQPFQPQQVKAFAQTVASPAAAVVASPAVAANTAYAAAQVVANAPVTAAKAAYSAAKQTYVAGKDAEAAVLRSDSEVLPDGFNYFYETNNGIAAQASGVTKKVDNENVIAIQGSYKYIDADGKEVQVTYVADENGYQPQSELLPVGPPIPEAIVRSLEYLRSHPQAPEKY